MVKLKNVTQKGEIVAQRSTHKKHKDVTEQHVQIVIQIKKQWTRTNSSFFLINSSIKPDSRSSLLIQIRPTI